MTLFSTKICNDVPSYRVGEETRAKPKGLTLFPNIYTSERYQSIISLLKLQISSQPWFKPSCIMLRVAITN